MRQVVQVLIIGAANPDQSLFIQTIRDPLTPRELRIQARSGGYDNFGEIRVDAELTVQLFGLPAVDPNGNTRLIWETSASYAIGFIVVVNCTRPNTFPDAQAVMAYFHGQQRLPCVVAAHHFDHPEATSLQGIRTALGVDDSVKNIACDLTQRESVKGVLLELVHIIVQSFG